MTHRGPFQPLTFCDSVIQWTACPEWLWSLLLWRYSKPTRMRSRAACSRWPCFGRGVGLDYLQRSFPAPTILLFCDAVHQGKNRIVSNILGLCSCMIAVNGKECQKADMSWAQRKAKKNKDPCHSGKRKVFPTSSWEVSVTRNVSETPLT